jgi:hypothetical protein
VMASTVAQWRQKGEGGRRYSTRLLPFIGDRGGWKKAAQAAGGAVVVAKPWARQSGNSHSPNAVGTGGAVVRTGG